MSDFVAVDMSAMLKPELLFALQKQISVVLSAALDEVERTNANATQFEKTCMVAGTCFISGLVEGVMRDSPDMNEIRKSLMEHKEMFP